MNAPINTVPVDSSASGSSARLAQIEGRMRRLERSARRWKLGTLAVALCLAMLALSAQIPAPRTIEAGAVVVRDPSSSARIQLVASEGEASFALHDAEGHLRAAIANEASGPILSLYGANGLPRLVVGQRDGAAFVIVRDSEGAPRAAMAVQETGEPSLYLLDENLDPLFREPR